MRVAVIGSGGREHAICDVVSRSSLLECLYAIPGNIGMADIATCIEIGVNDFSAIKSFC